MNIVLRNKAVLVLFLSAVMLLVSGTTAAVGIKKIAAEEILEIRLFENPSTGYRWQLDLADNNYLQLLQEDYQPLAENEKKDQLEKDGTQILAGRGGIKSWVFRGLEAGCQLLTFELKRSGGEAVKTVEYLVMVE